MQVRAWSHPCGGRLPKNAPQCQLSLTEQSQGAF